jgi:hypothetical protein
MEVRTIVRSCGSIGGGRGHRRKRLDQAGEGPETQDEQPAPPDLALSS